MKKVYRGQYGYLSYKKKFETIKTIILFLVPLSLFFAGIIATKSKMNVLTIVAVLGMLPASNSAVNAIMYLKSKTITEDEYKEFENTGKNLLISYDNVFTTYEKTYEVPVLVVKNKLICGYLTNLKDGELASKLEDHIKSSAQKEGYQVTVNMITKKETFLKRLGTLSTEENSNEKLNSNVKKNSNEIDNSSEIDSSNKKEDSGLEEKILKLLYDISL